MSLALGANGAATTAAAKGRAMDWDGTARVELVHVGDLFPGGVLQADDGARYDLRGAIEIRLPLGFKVKPWSRVVVERWRLWHARDLERWGAGVDFKRGAHRLRLYGGATLGELYFPSAVGGAWLDRRGLGAELRLALFDGLLGQASFERERDDFNTFYPERDGIRWSLRTGVERGFGAGRSIALSHLYRHSDSESDLYTYDHNSLRAHVDWPFAAWTANAEAEAGLRNYRTPYGYDRNHARQDVRWRLAGGFGRRLVPHLAAEITGEYRRSDSTRPGKDYDVSGASIALEVTR